MSEMVERMRTAFLQKLRELNTGVEPPACLRLDDPWKAAIEIMREPAAAKEPAGYWPNFCHDPSSCERNRSCMYLQCRHSSFDISVQIDSAVARETVIEECAKAVEGEHLRSETNYPEDKAYDQAIDDAAEAVRALSIISGVSDMTKDRKSKA